jgi:hypothetical protein
LLLLLLLVVVVVVVVVVFLWHRYLKKDSKRSKYCWPLEYSSFWA